MDFFGLACFMAGVATTMGCYLVLSIGYLITERAYQIREERQKKMEDLKK